MNLSHGHRHIWNIVSERSRVQDLTLLMVLWRRDSTIARFQRQHEAVIKPVSDAFCVFVVTLRWYWPEYCESLFIKQLVFCNSVMERVFLFQNIVGAEYIVCTLWLNTVGADAPTAPMVPTLMIWVDDSCAACVLQTLYLHVGGIHILLSTGLFCLRCWFSDDLQIQNDQSVLSWRRAQWLYLQTAQPRSQLGECNTAQWIH